MHSAAVISACGRYRYQLSRWWEPENMRYACFVMLNPSTADSLSDDPTIRRCRGFAQREECGGMIVVNLYPFRATKPSELRSCADPFGPEDNYEYVRGAAKNAAVVICGWGTNADPRHAARYLNRLRGSGVEPMCLGKTAAGHPRHPLYLRKDAPLVRCDLA